MDRQEVKKIAFVVGGLPFGGVETLLLQTVKELRRLKYDPIVINISGTGRFEKAYHEANITPLCVGNNTKTLKTTCLSTAKKLRALLKEIQPDIIHTAHFSAQYHARIAAVGLGIPVVTHCHNTKREKKFSRRLADRILSYATDMYIAVADAVKKQGVTPYNWAKRPCEVLYNAIDTETLDQADESSLNELTLATGPVVFSVCRLVTQKNMDMLIRAFARVKTDMPDASLLIIGDGSEKENLLRLANDLDLSDSLFMPGFRADIPGIMKALSKRDSLFAMPSQFEGFGIAPLEGFHFGIPAILSPFVPLKEIADGAVVISKLDEKELGESMLLTLRDKTQLKTMGIAAKKVALKSGIEPYTKRLLEIYRKVL